MRILSIISSPLQLINFKEYISIFNIYEYKLIILTFIKKEQDQILNCAKILNIHDYILINKYRIFQYFRLKNYAKLKFDRLIIGNFFSDPHLFLYNKSNPKSLVVLDDGINASLISEFYNSKSRIIKRSEIKNFFFKFFKINTTYPKKFHLFSSIENAIGINQVKIVKNNFLFLSSLFCHSKNDTNTYFIGQPFVELNICSKKKYLSSLSEISKKHKNIIYIPSRKESEQNLNHINSSLGINIFKTETNIELFFIENKLIPKKVLGFNSTALLTLNKIFNSQKPLIELKAFRMDFDGKRFKKQHILKYYKKIAESGIIVQEI